VPKDAFEVVGRAKPGIKIPGSDPAELFILSETKTAFKLQSYSSMTCFSSQPNAIVKLSGVVN
jgi:hypothetical protein